VTERYYTGKSKVVAKLRQERKERVGWIRKKFKDNAAAQALADKLEACRPNHRCKSLACQGCAAAAKRLFVRTCRRYLKDKSNICCVTIVPAGEEVDLGQFSVAEHARFLRRNKDRVARAHDGFFIGAVDWSVNENKDSGDGPFWCRHFHLITETSDIKALKRRLKEQFMISDRVRRPVLIESWDGDLDWLRYCHTDGFERRIISHDGKRFNKNTGKHRKCRETDQQPLKSRQKLELLLHLDEIGIAGRLFLRGVQFQNLRDTGPTFVNRPTKSRLRGGEGKEQSDQKLLRKAKAKKAAGEGDDWC